MHVFDTARHCQRANLTPRGAVHPIQTNWRERGRQVLCRPHLSRGGGVLGATPPDPGPNTDLYPTIHFNHCSTVTVDWEPTHPTNCGHIPATLPDDADSSKLESGAVAAMLRSTHFRSVLLAPRSHLEGLNYWQPCPTIPTYPQ